MCKYQQVLLNKNILVGDNLTKYIQQGGFAALQQALDNEQSIIEIIQASTLQGMGGAGFKTYIKWQAVANEANTDKYVICNGNEDEPGVFKDRFLLAKSPLQIIEAVLIACVALKANNAIFYLNKHNQEAIDRVASAIDQVKTHELFFKLEQFLKRNVNLTLVQSSGFYVAGEETAIISSIEKSFPFPRKKPPLPVHSGVFNKPTLINNAETFANITHIIKNGAAWYKQLGNDCAGTKLFSLSGDIANSGLYELPMGITLKELIFDIGGGLLFNQELKAVFVGGPSSALLTANDLDVKLDFESLKKHGSSLGTGAVIVVSNGTNIVKKIAEYINFFAKSSCGQCLSCKLGISQIAYHVQLISTGCGTADNVNAIRDLCNLIYKGGKCNLVNGATTMVKSSLDSFLDEYNDMLYTESN